MKHQTLTLCFLIFLFINLQAQTHQKSKRHYAKVKDYQPIDTLYLISKEVDDDLPVCGYINKNNDTIIQFGKYNYCWTDTFITFAFVSIRNGSNSASLSVAINRKEEVIFDMYIFDNGPDYFEDGLIRIKQNGKVGFADSTGKVVVKPKYQCAFSFENGQTQVTKHCTLIPDGEYHSMSSTSWFYIDKKGRKIKHIVR